MQKHGLYKFVDNEGDEHSLYGLDVDSATVALLQALPPGITVRSLGFEPAQTTAPPPEKPNLLPVAPGDIRPGTRRKAFGRNERCPCGSGKKVKHCCARGSK